MEDPHTRLLHRIERRRQPVSAHFVNDLWNRGQLAREGVAREECGCVKDPLHHTGMTGRDAIQGFREFGDAQLI